MIDIHITIAKTSDMKEVIPVSWILLEIMRFPTYRDIYSGFNDSSMMMSCLMIRQRTDLIKY